MIRVAVMFQNARIEKVYYEGHSIDAALIVQSELLRRFDPLKSMLLRFFYNHKQLDPLTYCFKLNATDERYDIGECGA